MGRVFWPLPPCFDEAVTAGINFFDTGDSYGTDKLEVPLRIPSPIWINHWMSPSPARILTSG